MIHKTVIAAGLMVVPRHVVGATQKKKAPSDTLMIGCIGVGGKGFSDVQAASTENIAGYETVEQFETVFVDDFRRPEEAIEGVKAVAAMKGANAIVNLKHDRTSAGRCSASGDAVVVRKKT